MCSPSFREAERSEPGLGEMNSHRQTKLLVIRSSLSLPCADTTLSKVVRLDSGTAVRQPVLPSTRHGVVSTAESCIRVS
jgi:hypothetical protein